MDFSTGTLAARETRSQDPFRIGTSLSNNLREDSTETPAIEAILSIRSAEE